LADMAEPQTAAGEEPSFQEGFVEADGFRIRYIEAGDGEPLITLHGGGGLHMSPAYPMLARNHRVIAFEVPGFGGSPANARSQSMQELATTMAQAVANLGIENFALMGNSFGGKLATWLAVQFPEKVNALILIGPAAIRPEGPGRPQSQDQTPEQRLARLYAHPERRPPSPPPDPEVVAKQMSLVRRVMGPAREEELEERMRQLDVPVLVLFGTEDRMIPPEMGRIYCETLPRCNLILVYDAGHEADTDRPEAVVSVVEDFLARHEGFLVNSRSGLLNP
jgi:pimeloyl-ACP methyl ester carboxylesterase